MLSAGYNVDDTQHIWHNMHCSSWFVSIWKLDSEYNDSGNTSNSDTDDFSSIPEFYLSKGDMPYNLREALRVINKNWIYY